MTGELPYLIQNTRQIHPLSSNFIELSLLVRACALLLLSANFSQTDTSFAWYYLSLLLRVGRFTSFGLTDGQQWHRRRGSAQSRPLTTEACRHCDTNKLACKLPTPNSLNLMIFRKFVYMRTASKKYCRTLQGE